MIARERPRKIDYPFSFFSSGVLVGVSATWAGHVFCFDGQKRKGSRRKFLLDGVAAFEPASQKRYTT